jgi:hypothetical protein
VTVASKGLLLGYDGVMTSSLYERLTGLTW